MLKVFDNLEEVIIHVRSFVKTSMNKTENATREFICVKEFSLTYINIIGHIFLFFWCLHISEVSSLVSLTNMDLYYSFHLDSATMADCN